MPVEFPPENVLQAFLAGTVEHTRRVAIFEPDAVTPWRPDLEANPTGGSVSVEYGRAERRTLDLTLNNADGAFVNDPGELWYDKIIKVYRGIRLKRKPESPRVAIVTTDTNFNAMPLRSALGAIGFADAKVFYPGVETVTLDQLLMYDIVIGASITLADTTITNLLTGVYNAGGRVLHLGALSTAMRTWAYGSAPTASNITYGQVSPSVSPLRSSHPLASGWAPFSYSHLAPGSTIVYSHLPLPAGAEWSLISQQGTDRAAVFARESSGNRIVFADIPLPDEAYEFPQLRMLLLSIANWLNPIRAISEWETQVGEFMIDRISEGHFPRHYKITGRDYSKKCMLSKFRYATQFATGQALETIIGSIAGAAGITKRLLPATGITVNKKFYFDRGVTRWDAMDEIAKAYEHEIFFDAQGYLVLRPMRDPATEDPLYTFATGNPDGVIVSFNKSTSDTRIYNVISVTGESSDQAIPPVHASAENNDPDSPTSVPNLGERVYEFVSSFIQTEQQAQDVADSFLKVHALEEYDASFETLMLPWLEVGDILRFVDPNPAPQDPDRLLLTTLTIPFELGPMSSSGKRVIKVV